MYDVCVVGLGYVGLPTACAIAKSGQTVIGVDNRAEVVAKVSQGKSHLTESGLEDAVAEAVKSGRLKATSDIREAVAQADAVIVAVQTPFEKGKVALEYLRNAVTQVSSSIRPGTVVILESTVPPGTCRRTVLPIIEKGGRKDGRDFYFAYCPERMAPGNSLAEYVANDRLIGAASDVSLEKAEAVMKKAVTGNLIRAELSHVEVSKLAENTARDVYIAFANDLAKISKELGVDVREVIRIANTHPRVKILSPGPGVGGPCLTKDPYLLLEGLDKDPSAGTTVRTARKLNDGMFREVLALVDEGGAPRKGSRVAVFGTSYKPQVGDPRSSPSKRVIEELGRRGYEVRFYDPFCGEGFGARRAATPEEALKGAACAIVMVAHKEFLGYDYGVLSRGMAPSPKWVDTVGVSRLAHGRQEYRLARLGDGTTDRRRLTRDK